MAAVQQNISYKRELLAGDIVEVNSELLEIGVKSIRFVHEMRNAETGEVAATARSPPFTWIGRPANPQPLPTRSGDPQGC